MLSDKTDDYDFHKFEGEMHILYVAIHIFWTWHMYKLDYRCTKQFSINYDNHFGHFQ